MGEFFPRGNFVLPTKWKIKIKWVQPYPYQTKQTSNQKGNKGQKWIVNNDKYLSFINDK